VVALLLVWSTGCTAPRASDRSPGPRADGAGYLAGALLATPYPLPDVTLTDTTGNAYNLRSSPSRPVVLMFFGYTHCPDVCLGVLSDVATALERMPPGSRDRLDMIFVTTDPARDTPAVIRAYLRHIDDSFVGLTGDPATITATADRLGVDIEGTRKLAGGGYRVGHTAQLIGFDQHREGVVLWTPSTAIGDLTRDFELLVSRQG
jgi:protein SCO1/2